MSELFPFTQTTHADIMLNVNTDVPTMEYIYSVLRGLRYHEDRQDVCHKRGVLSSDSMEDSYHSVIYSPFFPACEISNLKRMKEAS